MPTQHLHHLLHGLELTSHGVVRPLSEESVCCTHRVVGPKVCEILFDRPSSARLQIHLMQRYFPNAKIIADRFHVIRLVNHHFLKMWQQHDPVGRKNRGLLSLMRRHQWNLKFEQKINLNEYLDQYPVLKAMYEAKQKLNSILLTKNIRAKGARELIPKLMDLIDQFANSPVKALAQTLQSWLEPIVRMWRFSKSNGITEGFHTKMEMMSRRAYGFRNFENYRLRVLAHCGWNGVFNRV